MTLTFKRSFGLIFLICTLLAIRAPAADTGTISYDGHCLTINGQDTFIFSGAFHYFRCPKPLWRDRLAKMKAAGLNCVETYVAWNVHETQEPSSLEDMSKVDMTDLDEFLKICHDEFGFYTIIRPGPYICAEWKVGGYPRWINNKKPASVTGNWLRSDEPTYLDWSRHWYKACIPTIVKNQVTQRKPGTGGTILFQIENEYDYAGGSNETKVNHLRALYQCSRDNGITVPIMGCWTRQLRNSKDAMLKNAFDGPNNYPRENIQSLVNQVNNVRRDQPNAPVMIPEMQGGWFTEIGGDKLSEEQTWLTAAQIQNLTIAAIMHDTTISSYYMFFGGTNLGDGAAINITNTYDYGAPLRENGGVWDRYFAVQAIGNMLKEHGSSLARSDKADIKVEGDSRDMDVVIRACADQSEYLFIRNMSSREARSGTLKITTTKPMMETISIGYKLDPWGVKMVQLAKAGKHIQVEQKSLVEPNYHIERPVVQAKPIRISKVLARDDDTGHTWQPLNRDRDLLREGMADSRYAMYRASVVLTAEQVKKFGTLAITLAGADPVVAQVNGKYILPHGGGSNLTFALQDVLKEGENQIAFLLDNIGTPNGGAGMEKRFGIIDASLVPGTASGIPLTTWRAMIVEPRKDRMTGEKVDDSNWPAFELDDRTIEVLQGMIQPGADDSKVPTARILFNQTASATFRTTIELTQAQIDAGKTRIRFDSIDDNGDIYVNGTKVGYSGSWDVPAIVDAGKQLHPGKNVIAVVVNNRGGGPGGITKGVHLFGEGKDVVSLKLDFSKSTLGWDTWTNGVKDTTGWRSVDLDTTSQLLRIMHPSERGTNPTGEVKGLLTWYQIDFDLPKAQVGVWVPWNAKIDLSGNAFVFVNGNCLGRYWEIGPQREFYLPDCWLKPGEKNTISLVVRPSERGAMLRAVEIAPSVDVAEKR